VERWGAVAVYALLCWACRLHACVEISLQPLILREAPLQSLSEKEIFASRGDHCLLHVHVSRSFSRDAKRGSAGCSCRFGSSSPCHSLALCVGPAAERRGAFVHAFWVVRCSCFVRVKRESPPRPVRVLCACRERALSNAHWSRVWEDSSWVRVRTPFVPIRSTMLR